jgi:uncharacterized iron-regulated membrane protein
VELIETPHHESAVGSVARWIHGLHTVHYGGIGVRLLIFVLAMAGCITILSGNWLWLARRSERATNRVLARLTAGVGAGGPVAVATLMLVSRLLPLNLPSRPRLEELALALAFGSCVVWALAAADSFKTWWRQLAVAGSILASVPLAATHHSAAGLFGAGPRLSIVVAVDAAFLTIGGGLIAIALGIRRAALRREAAPNGSLGAAPDLIHGGVHD